MEGEKIPGGIQGGGKRDRLETECRVDTGGTPGECGEGDPREVTGEMPGDISPGPTWQKPP